MSDLNHVMLSGRLTADPELRPVGESRSVAALRIAVNRCFNDRDGERREDTAFVTVDVFGGQADSCHEFLNKGARVLVEGRLQQDVWDDRQTGEKRSQLKVIGARVHFLDRPDRSDFVEAPARDDRRSRDDGRRRQPRAQRRRE